MYKRDIKSIEDIELMVHSFYAKVRKNDRIGPVFNSVIQNNWDTHLAKMVSFWQTILLHEHTYSGSAFNKHVSLPITNNDFEIWLDLFIGTVNEHFAGTLAEEAKMRAEKMAEMFRLKLDYINNKA